jgi:hypothetical protein
MKSNRLSKGDRVCAGRLEGSRVFMDVGGKRFAGQAVEPRTSMELRFITCSNQLNS